MTGTRNLPTLLEILYGELTKDAPWVLFLTALADMIGATFATIILPTRDAGVDALVTPGVDPDRADEYHRLSNADPFVGLPEGQVVAFRDFVQHIPPRFREWLNQAGTGQILGVDLRASSGASVRLRITRDHSRPDFDERDSDFVASLIPHLRIAIEIHARLTATHAERQVYSSAMDRLAVATMILGRDGRILRRNAVADRLIDDGSIIAERNGRLSPQTAGGAAVVTRLLATAPPPGEEYRFEMPAPDGTCLRGVARALPLTSYGDGGHLALFLTDPASAGQPDPATLRDRFQLTLSEATLAIQLAQGIALVDAARALDIAHNTARSHLRAIFAKTGTHRQGELVNLLRTTASDLDL